MSYIMQEMPATFDMASTAVAFAVAAAFAHFSVPHNVNNTNSYKFMKK